MSRIVCRFSCGAASAVAAKLVLSEGHADVVIVNAYIKEEHEDNRRFLADCERWFGHPITVLRDEKYGASTHECWRKKRFIKSKNGAPCSAALKRDLMDAHLRRDDQLIIGFTAEEADRAERLFISATDVAPRFPLIERGLTKADCLAIIERAGIELPQMYRLGFNNANCIGCCKGGEGYWNKVRRVFPDQFESVARIEEEIGYSAYLFRDRATNERYGLRQLQPNKGRDNETVPACGIFCESAENELKDAV